jgi:hypothetical protein
VPRDAAAANWTSHKKEPHDVAVAHAASSMVLPPPSSYVKATAGAAGATSLLPQSAHFDATAGTVVVGLPPPLNSHVKATAGAANASSLLPLLLLTMMLPLLPLDNTIVMSAPAISRRVGARMSLVTLVWAEKTIRCQLETERTDLMLGRS